MKRILWAAAAVLLAAAAPAAEKPLPDEVRKVVDYYFEGAADGVVLVEAAVCASVAADATGRNECAVRLGERVGKGTEAFLWMHYLVPVGAAPNLVISFSRNGKVRSVVEFRPKPSLHYRTWTRVPTGVAGEWSIRIVQEMDGRDVELADIPYRVEEASD